MAQAIFIMIQYHYRPPTITQGYEVMPGQDSEVRKDAEEIIEEL
jgi:hypothetical protein